MTRHSSRSSRMCVLATLGVSLLAIGCAAARQAVIYPKASIESVSLGAVDLQSATIHFGVAVENPYSVGMPVAGLDFALSTQGREFLEGQADIEQTIPANGEGMVHVPVRVPFLEIYEVVSGLELGATIPYDAELGLRVQTPILGTVRLPMNAQGEIRLPG
jgi:LEA14-like dessication related protein